MGGTERKKFPYFMYKYQLITLAVEWEIPFPDEVDWNFLRQSVYDGWTREAIHCVPIRELYSECKRLGIKVSHGSVAADRIINFIENNGVAEDTVKFKARSQQLRTVKPSTNSTNIRRDVPRRIMGFLDGHRPLLVLICSRDSGNTINYKSAHTQTERVLKEGLVDRGRLVHVYLRSFSLTRALPTHKQITKEGGVRDLVRELAAATYGTQVLFVCIGIDGTSGNISGWKDFVDKYEIKDDRRLELFIAFGENERQWHLGDISWSEEDWVGPVENRMWSVCKLSDLVDSGTKVRLCQQIREQWGKCCQGRI